MLFLRRVALVAFAFVVLGTAAFASPSRKLVSYGDEQVEIIRDARGVPHVFAKTVSGAYFGQGYVCVEDRMWQLETYWRGAMGRMAEIRGPGALEHDVRRRRDGYTDEERLEDISRLSPRMRDIWLAYIDGVNAAIKERVARKDLPPEYARLGIEPEPFDLIKSHAIAVGMARRFGEGGEEDLVLTDVRESATKLLGKDTARKLLDDFVWDDDPRAPTTAQDHQRRPRMGPLDDAASAPGGRDAEKDAEEDEFLAGLSSDAHDEYAAMVRAASNARREQREQSRRWGLVYKLGSNAWVVAPRKSDRGAAMLFGGPMMGFRTPQIAYEAQLSAPGLNVAGMCFSGVPGVLIGANENAAWTTTSGAGDNIDWFRLSLNPENANQYRYKGEWLNVMKRKETFRVRGRKGPVTRVLERSRYGPISERRGGFALTVARTHWRKEIGSIVGIIGFNFARNLEQFKEGARRISTSHNFFWADRKGHIAWYFCGRYPIRAPGHDWRRVQPGDGSRDWRGMVRFEDQPRLVDPSFGYIGNWNNKPAANWRQLGMGEIFWGQKIYDVLSSTEKLTHKEFADIAFLTGTHDASAQFLKPFVLRALETNAPRTAAGRRARAALARWDNFLREGSVGAEVFRRWFDRMTTRLFSRYVPKAYWGLLRRAMPSLLLHVLDGKNALVPTRLDYLRGQGRDEAVAAAFEDAVARLVKDRGKNPARWGYKAGRISFSPLPSIRSARRGTFMMVAELSRDRVWVETALPPGQSEDPASPHYSDQRRMYENWEYKTLITDRDALLEQLGMKP